MTNPMGHAWFIHRRRFDLVLQKLSRDENTNWVETKVGGIRFTNDGAEITAEGRTINARWIIFANGSSAWTANFTGQKLNRVDSLVAIWAKLPTQSQERLLRIETTERGWWYSCPAEGDNAFTCFITDPIEARAGQIADLVQWNRRWQETHMFSESFDKVVATSIDVVSAGTCFLPATHGRSWVVVGDAAMKLDPIGSSGTITALESGRRAAIAMVAAMSGKYDGLLEYTRWSGKLLETFQQRRDSEYKLEALKRPGGFWIRRNNSPLVLPV
jgi:flavin-dependent dehydrogenase